MTILLLDLDWMFDKSDIPNSECMRVSSFHKQRKDNVFLITDMSELLQPYDKLYVFSNSDSTPALGHKIINDKRTILFGKRFEFCGAKQLGPVVLACRPDYLLYDVSDKNNSYVKANFITFFTDSGERISKRQEWKNTKKGLKRTIVADRALWTQNHSIILECLQEIQEEKNIAFLEPIPLKILIENIDIQQAFCSLNFSKGTDFKWKNNVGHDAKDAEKIINFLLVLKQHTKSDIGRIPFKTHLDGSWQDNFIRILNIIYIFRKNKLKCFFPEKSTRIELSYLIDWCENNYRTSFIEDMLFFVMSKKGLRWMQVLNNPQYWGDKRVRCLIQILSDTNLQPFVEQMCIQWGGNSLNPDSIDLELIKNQSYALL